MTVDETWVHYYEPENKAQSRQWVGPGSLRPTKFKMQPSAGKVMATVFWDAQGVIMLYFPAKRKVCLFVCVEVLRPSQPNGVMSSTVSLPKHTFTGQA